MVLPKTTPEQRQYLYEDVEELIRVGFLSHPLSIGKSSLCLRSLSEGDLYLMRNRAASGGDWEIWTVASSVWVLNGYNLLVEPHAVPRVAQTLRCLPRTVQALLFSVTLGLFQRANTARLYAEAFCYEAASRYLWRSLGRRPPVGGSGVPGAERFGMNSIQGMWVAFNQMEDDRGQMETLWEAAKLVCSSMQPKGIQKLDKKDQQRRSDEETRRQRVMDRAYYYSKGMVDRKGLVTAGARAGDTFSGARTAEELEDEMRRWVAGEEDWHDKVVSAYKQRVIDKFEEQKRYHQERMEALRRVSEAREQEEVGPMPLVGYTQAQLQEILSKRGEGRPGLRRIYPEHDPRQHLYERYLKNKPGPPQQMVVSDDGTLSPLDAAVSQRRVSYHAGSKE